MDTMRHEQFMRAKAEEEKHDPVNKPSHYTQGEIECIDAIEAALGPEGFQGFLPPRGMSMQLFLSARTQTQRRPAGSRKGSLVSQPHHQRSHMTFRNQFAENIFDLKYRHENCETWATLSSTLVHEVCDGLMPKDEVEDLVQYMTDMKFLPGGRYIYYAGRDPETRYYNNCFLLRAENDNREDWATIAQKATSALMSGGGIGVDWSVYRPSEVT